MYAISPFALQISEEKDDKPSEVVENLDENAKTDVVKAPIEHRYGLFIEENNDNDNYSGAIFAEEKSDSSQVSGKLHITIPSW